MTSSAMAKNSDVLLCSLALQSVPLHPQRNSSGRASAPQVRALFSLARSASSAQQNAVRGCRVRRPRQLGVQAGRRHHLHLHRHHVVLDAVLLRRGHGVERTQLSAKKGPGRESTHILHEGRVLPLRGERTNFCPRKTGKAVTYIMVQGLVLPLCGPALQLHTECLQAVHHHHR